MMHRLALPALVLAITLQAQEPLDTALMGRIREEGLTRSRVAPTVQQLCDAHGPRLTASPTYKAAAEWTAAWLRGVGLTGVALEPWDFGHAGWTNERFAMQALSPFKGPLHAEVVAWTPSTKGAVKGSVVRLDVEEEPLPEELEAAFARLKGRLRGKVVFVGHPKPLAVVQSRYAPRREEKELKDWFNPEQKPTAPKTINERHKPKRPGALRAREADLRIDAFLLAEKALARVNDAALRNGMVRAFANRLYDPAKAAPTVVLRAEDFRRLWRLMEQGQEAAVELDIRNRLHPELTKGFNVVAELKGTEKPEEIVLIGAHLDAWHTATGATDNGVNCVTAMEALRILKAVGAAPRRTIRVVLFDGEEQGLLGAKAFVKAHFGTFEDPLPGYGNLVAFLNLDGGAGLMRGLHAFGPPAAAQVLRELLAPFKDLGAVGASHHLTRLPKPDYADVTVFSNAGLPAMGPVQDSLEYGEYTWHTSVDSVERVPMDEVARNATMLASVLYHLAQRQEHFPHFTQGDMPAFPELVK